MIKQISRKFACLCVFAVVVYMACFLLLWNRLITVRTKSFRTVDHRHRPSGSLYDIVISRDGIGNVVYGSANPNVQNRVAVTEEGKELHAHRTCANKVCFNNNSRIIIRKSDIEASSWNSTGSKKYFLTEVLMVRIYKNDLAKWTIKELKQWLHFLFYAGVEHVYLCDHFVYQHECLKSNLSKYIENGLITYIEWPWNASNNGGKIMRHQVNCYSHVIREYIKDSEWQMSVDMDEFPVCLKDTDRLYLVRYLLKQSVTVSQILMPNFLMLGQGNRSKTMTIERITRITKKVANALTKPLYKTSAIRHPNIHSHHLIHGVTTNADHNDLRMLHYWGARLQNWGPDTNKTIEMTEEFDLVKDTISPAVKRNLISYGESDVFSNSTGP